jgi:hypothetical protein
MSRITKFVILAALLSLVLAPAAMAQIRDVTNPLGRLGPINTYDPVANPTGNGFPLWVEDSTGVQLDLVPAFGDPPIPDNPFSVATGFGAEAFFYSAESLMNLDNGGKALLVLAIEAAYGAEEPQNGDQFLFARVRIRIDAPSIGTYTVYHPWSATPEVFTVATVDDRNINSTHDWGGFGPLCPEQLTCFAAGISGSPGFERILIDPKPWVFLVASGFEENPNAVGDGALPTTVSGGVANAFPNIFRIEGPDIGGPGVNFIQTDQFTVFGHKFGGGVIEPPAPPPAAETDIVTINRARLRGAQVEVRAASSSGFSMTAELFAGATLVGSGNLGSNGRGNIPFTGATPDTVRVHSTSTNLAILGGSATAQVTN